MPGVNLGFTPINLASSEASPPEIKSSPPWLVLQPALPVLQPAHSPAIEPRRRRRKNPLVKEYLSAGRSGSKESMFERAAMSHGEEPQVKKRRIVKDPNAVDNTISVVAPLASMDIICANPPSSNTPQNVATYGGSLQLITHGTTNSINDDFSDSSKAHQTGPQSLAQATSFTLRQRSRRLARSPSIGMIIEEGDTGVHPEHLDNGESYSTLRQDSSARSETSIHGRQRQEDILDAFDLFDDGLSEGDLLQCLNNDTVSDPQSHLTRPLPPSSHAGHDDLSHTADVREVEDEAFDDGWGVLENEDLSILDQAEASMVPATILNQVSSNVQKVRATPVAVSSLDTEAGNVHPPDLKPILRPSFPEHARDRSPIIGLSAAMSLRTCFRIGEALNVGSQAVREHQSVIIELYARVRWSFREPRSVKQHFVFMDLFHDRPPYLNGTYECWKGIDLREWDSGRFLERSDNPLACRCMGKLKRDGTSWTLTILSIWEATLDDVEHVAGIVQWQCGT